MDDLRIAGRISGLYSGNGEMNVATYDDFPVDNDFKGPLFVFIDKLAVPLFIASIRRRSPAAAVIRFEDIDTPARAAMITGPELFIPVEVKGAAKGRGSGKGKATNGFVGLVGYRATLGKGPDGSGQDRPGGTNAPEMGGSTNAPEGSGNALEGEVTGFFENSGNPLFEVTVAGKQLYIPAVDQFIVRIDPASHHVIFSLPEGLAELYL